MSAGRDVEEYHFVRALFIVTDGELHRITDIAQFTGLGTPKLHTAGDMTAVNVKARNDSPGQHYFGENLPS